MALVRKAYILLHKPLELSVHRSHRLIPAFYTLLPAPLRQRPTKNAIQGVQAVGRLDQDTTGLLLLSDDGQFIHRMTSPKKHVPKVYEVTTGNTRGCSSNFKIVGRVVLDDDPTAVKGGRG